MTSPTMTPVCVVLRVGAHLLFFGLIALVVIREALALGAQSGLVIGLFAVLLITYALGAVFARPGRATLRQAWAVGGLDALSLEWVILLWFSSEAPTFYFRCSFSIFHFLGVGGGQWRFSRRPRQRSLRWACTVAGALGAWWARSWELGSLC